MARSIPRTTPIEMPAIVPPPSLESLSPRGPISCNVFWSVALATLVADVWYVDAILFAVDIDRINGVSSGSCDSEVCISVADACAEVDRLVVDEVTFL
jgi:hypothetical protein